MMNRNKINPNHYTTSSGAEIIDITESLNFNRGNVVKYVARAGSKPGEPAIDDLKKARWYLDREISRISQDSPECRSDTVAPHYRID